jgi:hypothetical protein
MRDGLGHRFSRREGYYRRKATRAIRGNLGPARLTQSLLASRRTSLDLPDRVGASVRQVDKTSEYFDGTAKHPRWLEEAKI